MNTVGKEGQLGIYICNGCKLQKLARAVRSYDNSKSTEHGYRLYKEVLTALKEAES
jgi:hypothetical protein